MAADRDGLERLLRALLFLSAECRAAGATEAGQQVDRAIGLHGASLSEFRGEADHALRIVAASAWLPGSVRSFARAVREETRLDSGRPSR